MNQMLSKVKCRCHERYQEIMGDRGFDLLIYVFIPPNGDALRARR
jgi:hypothetical protein